MLNEYGFLKLAEQISHSSIIWSKHCCIITTTSGRIVSIGINDFGDYQTRFTCHAEFNAIHKLKRLRHQIKHKRLDIYIARRYWENSKPCQTCKNLIIQISKLYKINRVIYTTKGGYQVITNVNEL